MLDDEFVRFVTIVDYKHLMKTNEPYWLNLVLNGTSTNHMNSKLWIVWTPQDPKESMNTVDILSHASTSKRMSTHMHST